MELVSNTFDSFATRTYGAYGHGVAPTDGARTGFAGEVGEADLPWYLLGDRFYLPSLQRFISPDASSPFGAGGLNRYAYCGGDPINRIDPSGEAWWEWVVAGIGLVAAVAATVATAGALAAPIAAAAAGSLTAAVSTTTMVTLTAAVVIDVVAVVAEIGAIASMAAGDEKAAGIFGWVALGTGVASAGLAGLSKAGTRAGRAARSGNGAPIPSHKKTMAIGGKYYERQTYEFLGGDVRIKHYQGEGALNKKVPDRQVVPKSGPLPMWHEHINIRGGINYAPDTKVGHFDVLDLMQRLRASNEKMPIVILSGAHGKSHGFNWAAGKRLHTDSNLLYKDNQAKSLYARTARVPTSEVTVIDLAKTSNSDFAAHMNSKARVIHAYCYGAADRELMYHFGVRLVEVYS